MYFRPGTSAQLLYRRLLLLRCRHRISIYFGKICGHTKSGSRSMTTPMSKKRINYWFQAILYILHNTSGPNRVGISLLVFSLSYFLCHFRGKALCTPFLCWYWQWRCHCHTFQYWWRQSTTASVRQQSFRSKSDYVLCLEIFFVALMISIRRNSSSPYFVVHNKPFNNVDPTNLALCAQYYAYLMDSIIIKTNGVRFTDSDNDKRPNWLNASHGLPSNHPYFHIMN